MLEMLREEEEEEAELSSFSCLIDTMAGGGGVYPNSLPTAVCCEARGSPFSVFIVTD